jgi:hypothetical protein
MRQRWMVTWTVQRRTGTRIRLWHFQTHRPTFNLQKEKNSNYANHLLNNSQSFDKHPTGPFEHRPLWILPEVSDGQSAPGGQDGENGCMQDFSGEIC